MAIDRDNASQFCAYIDFPSRNSQFVDDLVSWTEENDSLSGVVNDNRESKMFGRLKECLFEYIIINQDRQSAIRQLSHSSYGTICFAPLEYVIAARHRDDSSRFGIEVLFLAYPAATESAQKNIAYLIRRAFPICRDIDSDLAAVNAASLWYNNNINKLIINDDYIKSPMDMPTDGLFVFVKN